MDKIPAWLSSTLASDATEGLAVLPLWIGSLKQDTRAVGTAFVALMCQDDNLSVGGVLIRDGDLVIADDDGVVIWPKEQIDTLLGKAEASLWRKRLI